MVSTRTGWKVPAPTCSVTNAISIPFSRSAASSGSSKCSPAVGAATAQAAKSDLIEPFFGDTQIFIYPGYQYKVIDALITNFHLPESTLIMLVSAFAGYQHTMNAYKTAVEQKYRFFSYGDAMFITYNPQAISERP